MKLYQLTESYNNLWELVNDETMDLSVIESAIQQIESAIEVKCENSAIIMKGLESEIDAIDAEIKRLSEMKNSRKGKRDWLKGYMQGEMEKAGIDKVKAGMFTVALQNNPPSVEITGEVPAEFVTIIPTSYQPDKKRIAEYLKSNTAGWATLKQGKSLRIR